MSLCVLEKVSKTYTTGDLVVYALRQVDLTIDPGEFVAVMGPSGSGKTTLMNILGCLDVPSSGRYALAGKDVTAMDDDELSRMRSEHIGFIFQSFHLLPYATALENVLLPTLYLERPVDGGKSRALELLSLVGLEDRAHFRPNQLSGGQQQRVAIARALMNDPELVLADEPTGALDTTTAAGIMRLLSSLNERGKTIVVVTHDPEVAAYARRVIRMRDGVPTEQPSGRTPRPLTAHPPVTP
ncbi:putative ABC transport system ATP-binding protein [Desulfacinum hydrothermale DSM 13146]|uniref:Putative ABC transport system ATP-binding protein n=1 Tax=Desulfacinum hydrothermale DSM 13146 TaxID=1121390 RepID=A0A1W1XDG2_9BACT|nr:ABC transporter ATP-binding protein [Desulfacinum hydrothermale]SMC21976.1 putative ABC transport system ATP-binding protein [Desulfacinum hydrothermale DSM 13146]